MQTVHTISTKICYWPQSKAMQMLYNF